MKQRGRRPRSAVFPKAAGGVPLPHPPMPFPGATGTGDLAIGLLATWAAFV